uniref:Uncharacterized protein n=1 Tax=Oryza brachyantha TaxID=4533 RepID=J3MEX5_ORYBR
MAGQFSFGRDSNSTARCLTPAALASMPEENCTEHPHGSSRLMRLQAAALLWRIQQVSGSSSEHWAFYSCVLQQVSKGRVTLSNLVS